MTSAAMFAGVYQGAPYGRSWKVGQALSLGTKHHTAFNMRRSTSFGYSGHDSNWKVRK